jgi:hypothetical protein
MVDLARSPVPNVKLLEPVPELAFFTLGLCAEFIASPVAFIATKCTLKRLLLLSYCYDRAFF